MTRLQDANLGFSIDRSSPIPYYVQVREALRERIQDGTWKPGEQLPGEPELCRMFGISRTVIRQALNDLVYKGLVVREKGKGTFVAEPKIRESLVQKLTGFFQDMVEQGYTPVTQVLRQQVIPASHQIAELLRCAPDTEVIEIERLRSIQDEPIALVTTYLPLALCPRLLEEDLTQQSLYAFLEKQCGLKIASGHRTIEAVPANEREAHLLRIKKGAPLILLNSVSYLSDGTPVEYYHAVHRGDRSRFEVELVRFSEPGEAEDSLEEQLKKASLSSGWTVHPAPESSRNEPHS